MTGRVQSIDSQSANAAPASRRPSIRLPREVRRLLSPLAPKHELGAPAFPELFTLSPVCVFQFVPRPLELTPPEYVYVAMPNRAGSREHLARQGTLTSWNLLWESGALRSEFFAKNLTRDLAWIRKVDTNIALIPLINGDRFAAYSALYHLLPRRTLERFRLPLLKSAVWPETFAPQVIRVLPQDYVNRLSRALAHHIWPLLGAGGRIDAFGRHDPIRLLAHNLDFWVPHADAVIQERIACSGRWDCDEDKPWLAAELQEMRAMAPQGYTADRPYRGGVVWRGTDEAWEATREMVDAADRDGRLRGLVDAIRSHRVEEDFSDRWSYAREDFERKLYRKRRKLHVRFVELTDTVAVHGPESEVHADLLFEDFLALLNPREREIIVCIRSGMTRVGDIARELGYANHSPVSKALARIRRRARRELDA
jgi:hypothetical protein